MRRLQCLVLLALPALPGLAQKSDESLNFEVASIKASSNDRRGLTHTVSGAGVSDPRQFSRQEVTLFSLIVQGYRLQEHQLIGPAWLRSDHYNIAAKVPQGATKEQQRAMLRNLLAKRLHLVVHQDKREMPVFQLLLAKGGPKLKEWIPESSSTETTPEQHGVIQFAKDAQGFPILPSNIFSLTTRVNGQMVTTGACQAF